MLTFSILFNSMIASGIIGVLIYAVYSIVKKQVPSVPMLIALGFVLYELIATQYLLPHIGSLATAEHGYFSRDAIIIGVPFLIGILLIVYSLFVTVALGKKAPICSRMTFTESLVAIGILIVLSHPIVGTATTGMAIAGVLAFGATVVGYLINAVLSLMLYFYKNGARRHSIACGDEESCSSPFQLMPLVDIGSISVIGRSFVFGSAALMPISFWTLQCGTTMLNILIFCAVFASLVMLVKNNEEDGATYIARILGVVMLFFGTLPLLFGITDDTSPIPDEKMLVLYGMIATGLLFLIAGTIKSSIIVDVDDASPAKRKRQSTDVALIKTECVVSTVLAVTPELIGAHRLKKKYPAGR